MMAANCSSGNDTKHGTNTRRIVMAVDGSTNSEHAVKWFIATMHKPEDYLILIHVPEYKTLLHGPIMTADVNLVQRMVVEEQNNAKLLLARYAEIMKLAGVKGTVKQKNGQAGEQILDAAEKEGANFIVTGSRGLGTLRRTFLGSVSDYIVHHSTIPVLICKEE